MTTPKFKIGDRVKWADYECRARSGVITEVPHGNYAVDGSFYIKEAQELPPGRWHESHLALDVPEPKKYATDLESQLGAEIIKLHRSVTDLSNRLTEEIGGRARERIAKEAAGADTKRLTEGNKWLIDALSAEARAKEAAQKELAEALNLAKHNKDAFVSCAASLSDAQKRNSKLATKLADIMRFAGTP